MDEAKMRKQVQRAKMWNIIIFSLFAAIGITALIALGVFKYQHTFTIEKWHQAPNSRTNIVGDFFETYELIGMTKEEIISLLGEEEILANAKTSFKIIRTYFDPDNTIVYYLGIDYMDARWLIISLENDIVCSYCIDVT